MATSLTYHLRTSPPLQTKEAAQTFDDGVLGLLEELRELSLSRHDDDSMGRAVEAWKCIVFTPLGSGGVSITS